MLRSSREIQLSQESLLRGTTGHDIWLGLYLQRVQEQMYKGAIFKRFSSDNFHSIIRTQILALTLESKP